MNPFTVVPRLFFVVFVGLALAAAYFMQTDRVAVGSGCLAAALVLLVAMAWAGRWNEQAEEIEAEIKRLKEEEDKE